MFRHGTQASRTPAHTPPSAYRSGGVMPVASKDSLDEPKLVSRRISRTDLDFEQALRSEGTVRLREGRDLSLLGVSESPVSGLVSPPPRHSSSYVVQPSTPTIVPPTPTPGNSSLRPHTPPSSSTSPISSNFPDNEDIANTKRRSMLRSPGTASSPDLATLVRKAKEKSGSEVTSSSHGVVSKDKQLPEQQPTNSGWQFGADSSTSGSRSRPRSSTATVRKPSSKITPLNYQSNAQKDGPSLKGKEPAILGDWTDVSPTKESFTKNGKSSLRQKTTAFLGKLAGGGSMRDKNRLAPISSGRDPPPVPRVPDRYRMPTPSSASSSDVFYSLPNSPNTGKPLPDLSLTAKEGVGLHENDEDQSATPPASPPLEPRRVAKQNLRIDSFVREEEQPHHSHKRQDSSSSMRKRSMSTGTIQSPRPDFSDIPSVPTLSLTPDTHRPNDWDATVKVIMSDLEGIDIDYSKSLKDPLANSPIKQRPPNMERSLSDETPLLSTGSNQDLTRRTSLQHNLANTTTGPNVATRAASLDVPSKTVTSRQNARGTQSLTLYPKSGVRAGQKVLPSRPSSTNIFSNQPSNSPTTRKSDSQRLNLHSRSPASASEPSLLGMLAETKPRLRDYGSTVRLVPSVNSFPFPGPQPGTSIDLATPEISTSALSSTLASSTNQVGSSAEDIHHRGQELASRCWKEDESFLPKEKIAEWLGGLGPINKVALKHYIRQFDFSNLRLDHAFRRLCAKLYLKAETQQVDRILEEFGTRYWECNPQSLYGSASVVHSVAYSLLLLNTDLHVAELSSHMSRAQFVRNTLQVIQTHEKPPPDNTMYLAKKSASDSERPRRDSSDTSEVSGNNTVRAKRSGSVASWTSIPHDSAPSANLLSSQSPAIANPQDMLSSETGSSANSPLTYGFADSMRSNLTRDRSWEGDMELLLKDLYNSIKSQQILQSSLNGSEKSLSAGSPTVFRNGSRRGASNDRLNTLKRGSIRGLQSLVTPSPYSSNSSIDGRISPSPSFATSNADAFSASSSSFFSAPTFGFASNLSHTIIKETEEAERRSLQSDDSDSSNVSVSDAELALLGPPFAKEGSLSRKQYWEASSKRAKSKNWMDVFVVIQKGELDMFVFGSSDGMHAPVVGGGNWLSNASHVGSLTLAHSLAHSLPPPGYSRQRPHCFVLTLASGAVYFFQAGTEDLVNEWVITCNYWAARQSREPLPGGVSNMEYGWNRIDPNNKDDTDDKADAMSTRSGRSLFSKRSLAGSTFGDGSGGRGAVSPQGDRVYVNEWKPPLPPTIPSTLDEEAQLDAMEKQVAVLNEELEAHQVLQAPMMELYLPRSNNAMKALQNWKNKSQFLTSEIVKYDIYVDALKAAMEVRHRRRGEKALEKALVAETEETDTASEAAENGRIHGFSEDNVILEADEPSTPGPLQSSFSSKS